jgi:hypothetical protein
MLVAADIFYEQVGLINLIIVEAANRFEGGQ